MVSNKNFKESRAVLTSHFVQSKKLAKKIEEIPADKRTPNQRRFLSDLSDEARGIMTIAGVREIKAREAAAAEPTPSERAAEVEKIAEQKRAEAVAEKKLKGAKHGSKKKA
jgi:hypothetical protein